MQQTAKRDSLTKGPEVLAYMGTILANHLGKEGLPEGKASEVALNVMDIMKDQFGGQNIYFPKGTQVSVEEKAEEIFAKFKAGISIPELAHEYGHSIQWVYKLIADVRAKHKKARNAEFEAQRAKSQERWKREN